jgi:hypothetical protein
MVIPIAIPHTKSHSREPHLRSRRGFGLESAEEPVTGGIRAHAYIPVKNHRRPKPQQPEPLWNFHTTSPATGCVMSQTMPCKTKCWPDGMCVELYGFGSEPPPDEVAETPSVRAWQHVQEVFAGTSVPLHYVNINTDLEQSYWLRIWDFPTYRVVYGGREVARTNAMFASAQKLEEWLRQVAAQI